MVCGLVTRTHTHTQKEINPVSLISPGIYTEHFKSVFCAPPPRRATLHKTTSETIKMSLRELFQHCPDCGSVAKFFKRGALWRFPSLSGCHKKTEALCATRSLREVKVAERLTRMCPTEAPLKGGKVDLLGTAAQSSPAR